MALVTNLAFESGYIVVHRDSGAPTRYAIADVLRALDIPDLQITSLSLLTELANILVVIVKTLVEKEILSESFEDDHDLMELVDRLETLNAEW